MWTQGPLCLNLVSPATMSYLGCARPPPRPLCRGTNCSPPLRRAPLPGCLLLPLCLLRLVNTPSSWRCRSDVVQVSSPLGSLPLMPQPHPDPSPPGTTGFTQQLTNCERGEGRSDVPRPFLGDQHCQHAADAQQTRVCFSTHTHTHKPEHH